MKKRLRVLGLFALFLLIFLIYACKKEKPTPPIITTTAASEISYTTAISGGNVTNDGGATVTLRGVCWNTSVEPSISNSITTDNSGLGPFTSNITQLAPNTTYYLRAYATNSAGTGYGNQISFTTMEISTATITTTDVTSITQTSAVSGGKIISDGGSNITKEGVCWGTTSSPTISNDNIVTTEVNESFECILTGLTRGTQYYLRAYVTNSSGTSYGNEITFTTHFDLPTLSTISVSDITYWSAKSGGNLTDDGGDVITARGVCWAKTFNPMLSDNRTSDGTGYGSFISNITNLDPESVYYIRSYATNSEGTGYGNQFLFHSAQLTDIENNTYKSIVIGTQTWMGENLKVTVLNDGTPLILEPDFVRWTNNTRQGISQYNWYGNDIINKNIYGALYNIHAINTGKLCPINWHIPSEEEWFTLYDYVQGYSYKLEEVGTSHWVSHFREATNETGFTALPGGYRGQSTGSYDGYTWIGYGAFFWISNGEEFYIDSHDNMYTNKVGEAGLSVRCIKNN